MKRTPIFITLWILFLTFAPGARSQDSARNFEFGNRPPDGVFDPRGLLTPSQRKAVANPLVAILKDQRIDVLVVILPDIGDAPARHVAKGFRDAWSESPVNAIVLHVPGNSESPWIFPGEIIHQVVETSQLQDWIDAGELRASAETDDYGKIRAASVEATDIMRYCSGGALLRTEAMIGERVRQEMAHERKKRLMKTAALLGLVGIIPIAIGLGYLVANFGKSRPRVFPTVRKISRLGAPYAGGNIAAGNPKMY